MRLPLAGGSAAELAELVLQSADAARSAALSALLAQDPSLALWTACRAAASGTAALRSVDPLADWLNGCLIDVLQWSPEETAPDDPEASTAMLSRCADLAAASVRVARAARRLAEMSDPSLADEAYLAGLFHRAEDWVNVAGQGGVAGPGDSIPKKPSRSARRRKAKNQAVQAGRAGEENRDPNDLLTSYSSLLTPFVARTVQIARDASEKLDKSVRGRWLTSCVWADRLPCLTARLAHLAKLESQFAATLEKEKLEAMAELAAGAGHEINPVLAIISGRAQLLLHGEKDAERRHQLALVKSQATRVHEMIADMMLFGRPPRPQCKAVELVALVESLRIELEPMAAARRIRIERAGSAEPVTIQADPVQVAVALRAVCVNALEAIGADGRIEIAIAHDDDLVQITIRDDGPGISPEVRRHLFDPFYSGREAGRGLGLGLSKCWRIVTNHGGQIAVESARGRGATFVITLPATAPPVRDGAG
ncbi:MAG: sensor histidine kinase [Pirellulales bacterium]